MHLYWCEYSHIKGAVTSIGLAYFDGLDSTELGLHQAHDLFGRQPFDLRRFQPDLR